MVFILLVIFIFSNYFAKDTYHAFDRSGKNNVTNAILKKENISGFLMMFLIINVTWRAELFSFLHEF